MYAAAQVETRRDETSTAPRSRRKSGRGTRGRATNAVCREPGVCGGRRSVGVQESPGGVDEEGLVVWWPVGVCAEERYDTVGGLECSE